MTGNLFVATGFHVLANHGSPFSLRRGGWSTASTSSSSRWASRPSRYSGRRNSGRFDLKSMTGITGGWERRFSRTGSAEKRGESFGIQGGTPMSRRAPVPTAAAGSHPEVLVAVDGLRKHYGGQEGGGRHLIFGHAR